MKQLGITLFLALLGVAALAAVVGYTPEDHHVFDEQVSNPGMKTWRIDVMDANGNYPDNFLRLKLIHDPPEGISAMMLGGVSVWLPDPNYLVIDNAVYEPNSADPNMYGWFTVTKVWKHKRHEIGVHLFDMAGNSNCMFCVIDAKDQRPPKANKLSRNK